MPPHPKSLVENSISLNQVTSSRPKNTRMAGNVGIDLRNSAPELASQVPGQSTTSQYRPPMYKEAERLRTFTGWPLDFITPRQMTSAGFYFVGSEDIVRCAFCNIEVGHWVRGDEPMSDHRKWSPACKFVRHTPDCGNISLEDDGETVSQDSGYDTCGAYGIIPSSENKNHTLESLKVQKAKRPSFQNYCTLDARLKSFDAWPVSLKLKPQALSEAGFFYTGKGDQTLCFQCGGGLKDWEETDDPWVEHARWFSKCSYVILMKGQDFIDEVTGQATNQGQSRDESREDEGFTEEEEVSPKENELVEGKPESDKKTLDTKKLEEDARLCKICYGAEVGVAFLPCGHVMACPQCAVSLTKCASCRQPISATVRVFLS